MLVKINPFYNYFNGYLSQYYPGYNEANEDSTSNIINKVRRLFFNYNKIHNLGLTVYKEERKYWENGVYWTLEREEKLRETYPTEGSAAVRHFPGMTKQAVMAKASDLGVKYIKIRTWTPDEEEIMRVYYPIEGGKVINRLSGRKLTDIYSKDVKLKVQS